MMNYNNGILWVQGEAGARAWIVPPASSVLLMDAEQKRFYIKSADAAGMPSLRSFEYDEISPKEATSNIELDKYATKEDLKQIDAKFAEIIARLEGNNERNIQSSRKSNAKSVSEVQE